MFRRIQTLLGFFILWSCAGCTQSPTAVSASSTPPVTPPPSPTAGTSDTPTVQPASAKPSTPVYFFEVKNVFPHDCHAFTQGLVYVDGFYFESTGLYGRSSLRKVDLKTGKVLQKIDIPTKYFAEGMTLFQDKIYQITWKENTCFVYDPKTFKKQKEFHYEGEGWGLTHDGKLLIMSDGTNVIRFIDPDTFQVKRTIKVINPNNGQPLDKLNELEYIKGEIYANIWQTDDIVRIDPQSGKVLAWISMVGLFPLSARNPNACSDSPDVLNGIAYDPDKDRIFVTGKFWPNLYEIVLKKQP